MTEFRWPWLRKAEPQAWPFAAAALVAPLLVLYVPLGTVTLFVICALLVLGLQWRADRRLPGWPLGRAQTLLLLALFGWALVSVFGWSLDRAQGLRTWGGLLALAIAAPPLIGAARGLGGDGRTLVRLALGIGVTLAMFYLMGEGALSIAFPEPVGEAPRTRMFSRGLIVNCMLLAPALAGLMHLGRRRWALALLAVSVVAVLSSHSLSAKLGLGLGAAIFLAGWVRPGRTAAGLSGLIIVLMASFPLLGKLPSPQETMDMWPQLPNSAHHRLTIWTFTASKVLEHPLRGWGLDASRNVPGAEDHFEVWRKVPMLLRPNESGYLVLEQALPLHPHNGPGQVWLELGGVGIALMTAFLLVTIRRMTRFGGHADGPMAMATLGASFLVACVSFGMWQSWWQATIWVVAAMVAAVAQPDENHTP